MSLLGKAAMRRTAGCAVLACLLGPGLLVFGQGEADLKSAKTLFFDRKYAEAREVWQSVRTAGGPDAEAAAYWIARCSESLGESERALKEYGAFLERRPADRALAEEAQTSRVGLAARLYKAGNKQHLTILHQALKDPSKTVRYFAALQLAMLGASVGAAAAPVLCRIVSEERDDDLVERAKLGLLRIDPKGALCQAHLGSRSLDPAGEPAPLVSGSPRRGASWVKIRIFEKDSTTPKVSLNLPVALAEIAFKSLPDDAREELKRKGYNPDNFWERLKKLGPTEILSIVGDDGEKVQIWIE